MSAAPRIGRVFFPSELVQQAAAHGHPLTDPQAVAILKGFADQGLVVSVGPDGYAVTERGVTSSRSWNGYSLGQFYNPPPLTFARYLEGAGTTKERERVREDFEARLALYASGEMAGEAPLERFEYELGLLQARARTIRDDVRKVA